MTAAVVVVLLLFMPAVAMAILDPVDYLALQSLRKTLFDLPGSRFLSSWDFTGDPCAFPGVLCAGGRVVALALGDPRAGSPGLSGRLVLDSIPRLAALADLSLVPGRVYGPIPHPLPRSLRFLALSNNLLSGPIPQSLPPYLRTLDLSHNLLSGPIPQSLAKLPHLANLILSRNRLTGSLPWMSLSSPLVRLDLRYNSLSGAIPNLPVSLRFLAMSFNAFSGSVERVLPRLYLLSHLDLSYNKLSGRIPGRIFAFPVAEIHLQRNYFSGKLGMECPMSTAVERVDLSHNRLEGAVPAALAAAGVVYLNDNRFSGEVPAAFGERVMEGGMRVLYLQRNYLTGMSGIGPASDVPAGTALCLHYNCMLPPARASCPVRSGRRRTRPAAECPRWRKG